VEKEGSMVDCVNKILQWVQQNNIKNCSTMAWGINQKTEITDNI
jgi:hypothetical protein